MLIKVPAVWKGVGFVLASLIAPAALPHLADARRALATEPPGNGTIFRRELSPPIVNVRAKGAGPTPEAAFQSAVDDALRQAVTAEVSAADWRQSGGEYLAVLRQNGTGVLRGWHEVSSASERRLTGRVFHSEVAVEIDANVLRERLRSVGPVARR